MPLRCVDGSGASIEATASMTVEEWTKLRRRSRTEHDLSMPCCAAAAIPKTSSRGTRFFAHKAGAHCSCKPETEVHRTMKASAVEVARQSGWEAQSEAGGATPEGDRWTADVLCRKGTETVAIEIQWSAQTNEETWRRQDRYARSRISGVWLLRQPGFPVSPNLPATCIGGSLEEGLKVLIPGPRRYTAADRKHDRRWEQVLRPETFLAGVFEGRFKFGLPDGARVLFSIETGVLDCWRCGHPTRIVHKLNGAIGPHRFHMHLDAAERIPKLGPFVAAAVASRKGIGQIKRRFSATMQTSYWSNGCSNCDVLQGQHYEYRAMGCEEETVGIIELALDSTTKEMIAEENGELGWGVWDA